MNRHFARLALLLALPALHAEAAAPMDHPLFDAAFTEGYQVQVEGQDYRLHTQAIGELELPTGQLVACDPLVSCDGPFTQAVPKGRYPLQLAIARIGDDERVAFARIVFAPGPATRWEMALVKGQDPNTLAPDEFFGYGVDSGTGGFMDAAALRSYEARRDQEGEAFDKRLFAELDKTYQHTRSWYLLPTDAGNVALFSSGYGDGAYPSYFGYDADGRLVAVVTDFLLLPER
ncbi:DUF4241 domain-containing protein [Pseudomonas sp. TUM22785]|uniref:DUF4241 domain-containing protein n=1 Tax=Pseudomonas sp. TUM22785 TaxID=3019098 RepID=UPI0023054B1C|nr:DUF4241 domain-containing protein [Pseudomonas sp. TUM22785]WCD81472.1 DUF4241 domain-containing protein [Pseudomonas sp. TUM22785]